MYDRPVFEFPVPDIDEVTWQRRVKKFLERVESPDGAARVEEDQITEEASFRTTWTRTRSTS